MKKVIINEFERGIWLKKGSVKCIVRPGSYSLWSGNDDIQKFSLVEEFKPTIPLNKLLEFDELKQELYVIDVKLNQLVLLFIDGLLRRVLSPGKYAFWNVLLDYSFITVDVSKMDVTEVGERGILDSELLKPYLLSYNVRVDEKVLMFVDGQFDRLLDAGLYYFWRNSSNVQFYKYNIATILDEKTAINGPLSMDVLLRDANIRQVLEVIEVGKDELLLIYENALLKAAFPVGVYAYWKNNFSYKKQLVKVEQLIPSVEMLGLIVDNPVLTPFVRVYAVNVYEKGILYVDGQFEAILEPGTYTYWKNDKNLVVYKCDTRAIQMDMNGQEILTKDKANIRLNLVFTYKIYDIVKAASSKEYDKQLYSILQLAVREAIAVLSLDELLDKREQITIEILSQINGRCAEMGIAVINGGIRDIILPGDVKDIMNQVLVAEKKAQANIIMRREETASTRSLLNTAKLMEENAMLLKLKEMEYVEKIADKINSITLNNGGDMVSQLKQIFVAK